MRFLSGLFKVPPFEPTPICPWGTHGPGVRLGAIREVEWRYCRSCGWLWTTRAGVPNCALSSQSSVHVGVCPTDDVKAITAFDRLLVPPTDSEVAS